MERLSPESGDPDSSKEVSILASDRDSRRRFLSRSLKVLLGGLTFQGCGARTVSSERRPPAVSWREAMHYTKKRKPAG